MTSEQEQTLRAAVDGADPRGDTTHWLRRAIDGDEDGWTCLVERLSPFLCVQAAYRLGTPLSRLYDPEDLVNEVWIVAFTRMDDLRPRGARMTPVLLRFLSKTLLHKVNDLMKRHLVRGSRKRDLALRCHDSGGRLSDLARRATSAVERASRSELNHRIREALSRLPANDREVLVLRGIEGLPVGRIAERLELNRTAVSMRYRRALERLRERLPAALVDDLFTDAVV